MPRADSEWGDWDESQYDVPPRPSWLEDLLSRDEHKSQNGISTLSKKRKQSVPLSVHKEAYLPSLRDFRCWYVWARETGRHERYLQQIEALAIAFKRETPDAEANVYLINPNISLSEVDFHNMKNDQLSYQELLENFIQDAKTIINNRGSNEIFKGEKIIRYRSKKGDYVLSYYSRSDKLTIEKNGRLLAYQQRSQISIGDKFVTQNDAVLFRRAATYRCDSPRSKVKTV